MGRPRSASSDRYITNQGYVMFRYQNHPLASQFGEVLEHRKVLWDKVGDGEHCCNWCGRILSWGGAGGIHVDHLDDDRLNNSPENLVVSCKKCNGDRGKEVVLPRGSCCVSDCDDVVRNVANQLCSKHYQKALRKRKEVMA